MIVEECLNPPVTWSLLAQKQIVEESQTGEYIAIFLYFSSSLGSADDIFDVAQNSCEHGLQTWENPHVIRWLAAIHEVLKLQTPYCKLITIPKNNPDVLDSWFHCRISDTRCWIKQNPRNLRHGSICRNITGQSRSELGGLRRMDSHSSSCRSTLMHIWCINKKPRGSWPKPLVSSCFHMIFGSWIGCVWK